MPRLALALAILWLLTVFVLRTALQWWQTGSTGIKGVTGPVCSLSWSAGLFANLGVICSGIAPLGTIYGWLGGVPLFANDTLHITGAVLMLAGISGAFIAQLSMGDSWRIGVDDRSPPNRMAHPRETGRLCIYDPGRGACARAELLPACLAAYPAPSGYSGETIL